MTRVLTLILSTEFRFLEVYNDKISLILLIISRALEPDRWFGARSYATTNIKINTIIIPSYYTFRYTKLPQHQQLVVEYYNYYYCYCYYE